MTATSLSDADARERIRSDLDTTLVVEAAAGTGKTTELVARIIALVRTGRARLSSIAAVTFTDKAAGEMKLRLRAEVERARTAEGLQDAERAHLDAALQELEVARIGTIHSFCSDLLRERPVEAGVDPLFEVAADDADRLYDTAFDGWLQSVLPSPPEGIRRVLRRPQAPRDGSGPIESLRAAGAKLIDSRDFATPWSRLPFDLPTAVDFALTELTAVAGYAELAERKDDYLAKNLREIARFVENGARLERGGRPRDYDGLEAELRQLAKHRSFRWKGFGKTYGGGLSRAEVLAQRDAAKTALDELSAGADADLAACLFADLQPLVAAYEDLKRRAGRLDFLDLLLRARDLIKTNRGVREAMQKRISHILVDEFQDTDPLQAELLLLLAADDPQQQDWTRARPVPGKLFVVGDPKQSIYRFRRADVALYEATKQQLLEHGADLLFLQTSFRSAPGVQSAVNAAFAEAMGGDGAGRQAAYVPLKEFRNELAEQPAIVALPVPRPYGDWGKVTSFRIDASYPDAVGAFVQFLLEESGWKVTEREHPKRPVPVEARHICLLFKRFQNFGQDVPRPYARALEARSIPHVLVGGHSYHAREEVLALRNALTAIEWPEDELSVFATLRGPLFALPDDALLAFRHAYGSWHPLRQHEPPEDPGVAAVAEALGLLGRLTRLRGRRAIAATIAELLEQTRAHAGVAVWVAGEQALANLLRVTDLARRFEAHGAVSFRGFVEHLQQQSEQGEASEAPVVEEGTEGVRMMTVHRAKGLEFPIVILADPLAPDSRKNPSRHVDHASRLWATSLCGCIPHEVVEHRDDELEREREEAVRVTYVAATRARRTPQPAAGCPRFGTDSVYERPAKVERPSDFSVAPGRHRPRAGSHEVVWWDPAALTLDVERDMGLRDQMWLAEDVGGASVQAGIDAHEAWQAARRARLERGAVPSEIVRTATEIAKGFAAAAAAAAGLPQVPTVQIESTNTSRVARPHGKRFGILVHATLAVTDLAADEEAVRRVARAQAVLLAAPKDEVDAAVQTVVSALRHDLIERARRSSARGQCHREAPLVLRRTDGSVLEGIVDLAFREVDDELPHWTVVDFKTDVTLRGRADEYAIQVDAYVEALVAATGEPARGVLLWV